MRALLPDAQQRFVATLERWFHRISTQ